MVQSSIRRPSRRGFLAGAAALATGFPAPAILAQTRLPLKLGILNSFTGVSAYSGELNVAGMELYFDRIGWTIAGRKVEMLKEDDQFNPQVGLQKAKKFVLSDHVDMICGPQASNVALALLNYIKESGAFLIVSGAGVAQITWERIPYMFRTTITTTQLCQPMGGWIYDNLAKEIVLTGTDYAAGRDTLREFKASYEKAGGKVIKEIYPPLGTTDFSPYLADVRSIAPPATYNFYVGTDATRFVQQYAELGLKDKIALTGFGALVDSRSLQSQDRAALGVYTTQIYCDTLDNAENKRFVAEYRAKHKEYPNVYCDYGFVTARVIDEALKAVDGNTENKDKLSEAMAKVAFDAPRGPFRFDPVVHHPIQNVYICDVRDIDGRIAIKDIATIPNVRDPGVKD
jgi:branched-chain amino acid transport system substrate-binding protein